MTAPIVELIGDTPLIRLKAASDATGCEIFGKAEFLNPGGSVKDRTALGLIRAAEADGSLTPGGVIVEGTAGNTGIGIGLVGAAMGFRTIIVIPETQSQEKKDMIRIAGKFGFKVHYGDGTRLDVLRASGADTAEAILVCVDDPHAADRIVELCQSAFPNAQLYVRAFDRGHSLRLNKVGVQFEIRETFESALVFSRAVLTGLGLDEAEALDVIDDVRERDKQRVELELIGGLEAGRKMIRGNAETPEPEPFFKTGARDR